MRSSCVIGFCRYKVGRVLPHVVSQLDSHLTSVDLVAVGVDPLGPHEENFPGVFDVLPQVPEHVKLLTIGAQNIDAQ